MVSSDAMLEEPGDRRFVEACHEAWRRRLGQLGERARRERASFPDLASREFEQVRVRLARCKNAASLREAVTGFWARAGGPLPSLQRRWPEVLPLLDERNWRRARDLALLALASYSGASGEAGATHESQGEEGVQP